MKILKQKTVIFGECKEKIRMVELNDNDRRKKNVDCRYAILFGEYKDVDMESDSLEEILSQFEFWGMD